MTCTRITSRGAATVSLTIVLCSNGDCAIDNKRPDLNAWHAGQRRSQGRIVHAANTQQALDSFRLHELPIPVCIYFFKFAHKLETSAHNPLIRVNSKSQWLMYSSWLENSMRVSFFNKKYNKTLPSQQLPLFWSNQYAFQVIRLSTSIFVNNIVDDVRDYLQRRKGCRWNAFTLAYKAEGRSVEDPGRDGKPTFEVGTSKVIKLWKCRRRILFVYKLN